MTRPNKRCERCTHWDLETKKCGHPEPDCVKGIVDSFDRNFDLSDFGPQPRPKDPRIFQGSLNEFFDEATKIIENEVYQTHYFKGYGDAKVKNYKPPPEKYQKEREAYLKGYEDGTKQ